MKHFSKAQPLAVLMLSACLGGGGGGSSAPATHTIGGTVSGLKSSVVLQNNGAGNHTVSANGPFNFPAQWLTAARTTSASSPSRHGNSARAVPRA